MAPSQWQRRCQPQSVPGTAIKKQQRNQDSKKVLGAKRRSSEAVSTGPRIYYDGEGCLRLDSESVSTAIFRDIVADAIRRKRRYFLAGDCRRGEAKSNGTSSCQHIPAEPPQPPTDKDNSVDDVDEEESVLTISQYDPRKMSKKKKTKTVKKVGFDGMLKCYVERRREQGPDGSETHFVMKTVKENEVLISACNVTGTTSFHFATGYPSSFMPGSSDYLAHVKCNFVGTTFTIYDHGCSSDDLPSEAFPEAMRCEHGAIIYETNILGRVPNAMTVILPNADGTDASRSGLGIVRRYQKKKGGIMKLRTKKPIWNADLDAWTMDFKGRVKLASKKTFSSLTIQFRDRGALRAARPLPIRP